MYDTLTALSIGNSNSTTFEVEDPADGPVYFTGWTKATDVQVNVLINSPPSNTTSSTIGLSQTSTSSSSAGTGTAKAAGSRTVQNNIAAYFAILVSTLRLLGLA